MTCTLTCRPFSLCTRMSAVAEPRLSPFSPVEEALDDVRQGKFVVVVDDPDRDNEGDLVIAAQFAMPEAINSGRCWSWPRQCKLNTRL